MDGVRGYIRELRIGREASQKDLASAMGIATSTLIAYEMGRTEEVKAGPLLRAVRHLGGDLNDLLDLADDDTPYEAGAGRAAARLAGEPVVTTDHVIQRWQDELTEIAQELRSRLLRPSGRQP